MINIIGNIFGCSGYDSHTRNLVKALDKVTEVRLTTGGVPNWERLVNDKELELIKRPPEKEEINLIITNPIHWSINATAKRNIVYLITEGDRIPVCFIKECMNSNIDKILCPSRHVIDAVMETTFFLTPDEQSELCDKLELVPHGVDLELFYPKEKPTKCTFLANKGFRNLQDRGGIQYLIKAYLEEFTIKDDVELILKINPAYGIQNLQKLLRQISPRNENLPRLIINTDNIPYNKMVDLYNSATVFVSPTRAEAYNLPCIEACATGIPVITTKYGGQTDYINNTNGWIIGGKLEEVEHEVMYEGCSWLKPDIEELRVALRYAYEHPEKVLIKGKVALETASKNTWDITAKKIVKLINTSGDNI